MDPKISEAAMNQKPGATALASLAIAEGRLQPSGHAKMMASIQAMQILPGLKIYDDLLKSSSIAKMATALQGSLPTFKIDVASLTGVAAMSESISRMVSASMPAIGSAAMMENLTKGLRIPSAAAILGDSIKFDTSGLFGSNIDWSALLGTVTRSTAPIERTIVVPAKRTGPTLDEVVAFLARLHPALKIKYEGMYEAIDGTDGISQSANSAAELLILLTYQLAPYRAVWMYISSIDANPKGKFPDEPPPKDRHFELIAHKYRLDFSTVMELAVGGLLANEFQKLKHNDYKLTRQDAEARLMRLIDKLEDLLSYLVQSLQLYRFATDPASSSAARPLLLRKVTLLQYGKYTSLGSIDPDEALRRQARDVLSKPYSVIAYVISDWIGPIFLARFSDSGEITVVAHVTNDYRPALGAKPAVGGRVDVSFSSSRSSGDERQFDSPFDDLEFDGSSEDSTVSSATATQIRIELDGDRRSSLVQQSSSTGWSAKVVLANSDLLHIFAEGVEARDMDVQASKDIEALLTARSEVISSWRASI